MNKEKAENYYRELYSHQMHYHKHYKESRYFVLWTQVMQFVKQLPRSTRILEIGCGTGQFAQYLYEEGYRNYIGFDFCKKAIEIAEKKCMQKEILYADARDNNLWQSRELDYDLVIALETLEHIKCELRVIENIKQGSYIIFSLPQFDDPAHIRFFYNPRKIVKRYYRHIDIKKIVTIGPYFVVFGLVNKATLSVINKMIKTRAKINVDYFIKKMVSMFSRIKRNLT